MAAKELQAIIDAHHRASERGEQAALVTVVKTAGSTYRRAGARMWVGSSGKSVGSISGGCLEDDARDRAREVIASGEPAIIHYDTTSEGDILWGSGAGCQGVVHVLVEPLAASVEASPDAGCKSVLDCLALGLRARRTAVLATVFHVENSERVRPAEFVWSAESIESGGRGGNRRASLVHLHIADATFAKAVQRAARAVSRKGTARVQEFALRDGGSAEVFFDVVRPAQALLILGAGDDAIPVARLAGNSAGGCGWPTVAVLMPRRSVSRGQMKSCISPLLTSTRSGFRWKRGKRWSS